MNKWLNRFGLDPNKNLMFLLRKLLSPSKDWAVVYGFSCVNPLNDQATVHCKMPESFKGSILQRINLLSPSKDWDTVSFSWQSCLNPEPPQLQKKALASEETDHINSFETDWKQASQEWLDIHIFWVLQRIELLFIDETFKGWIYCFGVQPAKSFKGFIFVFFKSFGHSCHQFTSLSSSGSGGGAGSLGKSRGLLLGIAGGNAGHGGSVDFHPWIYGDHKYLSRCCHKLHNEPAHII